MEKLVLDNGIKTIAIENQDGELVTVLKINIMKASTAERFAELIQRLNNISEECEREAKKFNKELIGKQSDDIDMEQVIAASRIKVSYLERIINEIDGVFGENTIHNVYSDAYELDPDFVPDEIALVEFVDKVIPVMNSLFGKRFDAYNKKYNANRKGSHTKTKKELIEEYRKKNANE